MTAIKLFVSLLGTGLALGGCAHRSSSAGDCRVSAERIAAPSIYSGWVAMGFVADLRAAIDTSPANTTGSNFTKVDGAITAQYGYGLESIRIRGPFDTGFFVDRRSKATPPPPTAEVNGETVAAMTGMLSGDAADRLFEAMKPVPSVNERRSPAGRIVCLKDADRTATCLLQGLLGFSTKVPEDLYPDALP